MTDAFDTIQSVKTTKVADLTGEHSPNQTHTFDVIGTDLGIMAETDDKIYIVFGDTWSYERKNWRSNVLAYTTDRDASDGITIDGWITDERGQAKELIRGHKDENDEHGEVTKIPTALLAVGSRLYMPFMSVRHWGQPGGRWDSNYATWSYSDDGGHTWEVVDPPFWSEESGFIMHAVSTQKGRGNENGDVHILATPSGRFGGVKHARVSPEKLLDPDAYRYFSGYEAVPNGESEVGSRSRRGGQNDDGQSDDGQNMDAYSTPVYVTTPQEGTVIIPPAVGEGSLLWNDYLDRWIYTYFNEHTKSLEVRSAPFPWGPWSKPHRLTDASSYPALYGAFMTPSWTEEGGRVCYFLMSMFGPYNVYVMRAEFTKR